MKVGDTIEGTWFGKRVKLEARLRDEESMQLGYYCGGCYFNRGTGFCECGPGVICWGAVEKGITTHLIFKEI